MSESIKYTTEFNPSLTTVSITESTSIEISNDSEVIISGYDINGNEIKGYNSGYEVIINSSKSLLPVNIFCLYSGSTIDVKIIDNTRISRIDVKYYSLTKTTKLNLTIPAMHNYYISGNFVLMSYKDGEIKTLRKMRIGRDSEILRFKANGEYTTSKYLPNDNSTYGRNDQDVEYEVEINEKYFVGRDGSILCAGIENFQFSYT